MESTFHAPTKVPITSFLDNMSFLLIPPRQLPSLPTLLLTPPPPSPPSAPFPSILPTNLRRQVGQHPHRPRACDRQRCPFPRIGCRRGLFRGAYGKLREILSPKSLRPHRRRQRLHEKRQTRLHRPPRTRPTRDTRRSKGRREGNLVKRKMGREEALLVPELDNLRNRR